MQIIIKETFFSLIRWFDSIKIIDASEVIFQLVIYDNTEWSQNTHLSEVEFNSNNTGF